MPHLSPQNHTDELNLLTEEIQDVLGRRFSWSVRHGNLLIAVGFLAFVGLGAIVPYPISLNLTGTAQFLGTYQRIVIPVASRMQPHVQTGQYVQKGQLVLSTNNGAVSTDHLANQSGRCFWEQTGSNGAVLSVVPTLQTFLVRCNFPVEKAHFLRLGFPVSVQSQVNLNQTFEGYIEQLPVLVQDDSCTVFIRFSMKQPQTSRLLIETSKVSLHFALSKQSLLTYMKDVVVK